jgi:hypothetical protein
MELNEIPLQFGHFATEFDEILLRFGLFPMQLAAEILAVFTGFEIGIWKWLRLNKRQGLSFVVKEKDQIMKTENSVSPIDILTFS